MKRKVVNPDPNHQKKIKIEEKLQDKDLNDLISDEKELEKEIKYKTKPHKSYSFIGSFPNSPRFCFQDIFVKAGIFEGIVR